MSLIIVLRIRYCQCQQISHRVNYGQPYLVTMDLLFVASKWAKLFEQRTTVSRLFNDEDSALGIS